MRRENGQAGRRGLKYLWSKQAIRGGSGWLVMGSAATGKRQTDVHSGAVANDGIRWQAGFRGSVSQCWPRAVGSSRGVGLWIFYFWAQGLVDDARPLPLRRAADRGPGRGG